MIGKRVRTARKHWRLGREFGIPVCCRLRFCVSLNLLGHWGQVARRGITDRFGEADEFVPCLWVHRDRLTRR